MESNASRAQACPLGVLEDVRKENSFTDLKCAVFQTTNYCPELQKGKIGQILGY